MHDLVVIKEEKLEPVEPFECEFEGIIGGFLNDYCRIRFAILADSTLTGQISKKHVQQPTHKRPKLLTKSHTRAPADPSSTSNGGEFPVTPMYGECGYVVCAYLHGTAAYASSDQVAELEYCCKFTIAKCGRHSDRHTIICHAHLTPTSATIDGTWSAQHQSTQQYPFQLQRVDQINDERREESTASTARVNESTDVQNSLYPLSPGKYEFRGYAAAPVGPTHTTPRRRTRSRQTVGRKDECFVTLRLLADGTLKGISKELRYPQICELHGTWRIDRVRYVLEYKVRDAVGKFCYSGRVNGLKLVGKWWNIDENDPDAGFEGGKGVFEFELMQMDRPVSQIRVQQQETTAELQVNDDENEDRTIKVFTTGEYKLRGLATDTDGYDYECELEVQLLSGGFLKGTCRELIFEQTRRISGLWTRTKFLYQQEYVVSKEVGTYLYSGTLADDGVVVNGTWQNALTEFENVQGEYGTFAYAITSVKRRWTTGSHVDFPKEFRESIYCVLLCSSRTHTLPSSLWQHVFCFCDENWFTKPTAIKLEPRVR